MVLGDRPAPFARLAGGVTQARKAFSARPVVHFVKEFAALLGGVGGRHRAHHHAFVDQPGEQSEPRADEMPGHVMDHQRVAQIGLVAAIFEHRVLVGDARKGAVSDRATIGEFFEQPGEHRLDRREHVVLGDEAHLEVELVEFAGTAVGAGILVAEAGGDLEIAVEPRDHQQLLEHLRRLRERVEFARMNPARHQIVARAFGG